MPRPETGPPVFFMCGHSSTRRPLTGVYAPATICIDCDREQILGIIETAAGAFGDQIISWEAARDKVLREAQALGATSGYDYRVPFELRQKYHAALVALDGIEHREKVFSDALIAAFLEEWGGEWGWVHTHAYNNDGGLVVMMWQKSGGQGMLKREEWAWDPEHSGLRELLREGSGSEGHKTPTNELEKLE